MFRLVFVVLAVVGLFSLLSGALGTAAAGMGALVLLPILLFKLFLILMILGFISHKMCGRDGGRRRRRSPRWGRTEQPGPSREDRFAEWHRMAHAKEEVDSWVDGMPDFGQE